MVTEKDLLNPPKKIPKPIDDGACNHLKELHIPTTHLCSTSDKLIDLSDIKGRTVVFCYPRTAEPGKPFLDNWNSIPGARGCTPQNCSYRDNFKILTELGVKVYGLSVQDTDYQKELVQRLSLPFDILSDTELTFAKALSLPTFSVKSMELIKRLTLIIYNGKVEEVFYPVFPSDQDVINVIKFLKRK